MFIHKRPFWMLRGAPYGMPSIRLYFNQLVYRCTTPHLVCITFNSMFTASKANASHHNYFFIADFCLYFLLFFLNKLTTAIVVVVVVVVNIIILNMAFYNYSTTFELFYHGSDIFSIESNRTFKFLVSSSSSSSLL